MPGTYFMPAINILKRGGVSDVSKWVSKYGGSKAFIVASLGEIGEKQGDLVADLLGKSSIDSVVFANVGPNPADVTVHEGADLYRSSNCDILIAIGGGSAIDCAKAIGLIVTNGGHISDYDGINKAKNSLPPFIAIATTAGTGSEVTQFSIITDSENHNKMTIVDWHFTANVAINDPDLMVSMPPSLTSASGMDALSHAVEAYLSQNHGSFSDALAIEAIGIIRKWLPVAFEDGSNIKAREKMCAASSMAGIAFNNSGLGYVHAMSHPVTALYGTAHGVANTILMPAVTRFNSPVCTERLAKIALAMGVSVHWHSDGENAEKAIAEMTKMGRLLNMPLSLREVGVKRDDIPLLAARAVEEATAAGNPRKGDVKRIEQIYYDVF